MKGANGGLNIPDRSAFTIVKALPIDSNKNALFDSMS
jgi:hypothetical protein